MIRIIPTARKVFSLRTAALILPLLIAGFLSGCYIVNLYPLSDQADLVFDSQLTGVWQRADGSLRIFGDDVDNLRVEVSQHPGDNKDSARTGVIGLELTVIGGHTYMDLQPPGYQESLAPVMEQMLYVPMRMIFRYEIRGMDTLIVQSLGFVSFNSRWSNGKSHGLTMERPSPNGPLILTATTRELRKFLAANGNRPETFGEPVVYVRQRL